MTTATTDEPLGLVTLRSPQAFAPATLLLGALGVFFAAIEAIIILPGATVEDAVITAVAAALAVPGLLACCGHVLARTQTRGSWWTIGSYLLGGIVYALIITIAGRAFGSDQYPEFTARSLVSVILVAGWFVLVGILLTAISRDRQSTAELGAERSRLDAQKGHYGVAVRAARKELRTRIDAVARPAIQTAQLNLSQLRTHSSIEANQLAHQLRTQAQSIRDLAEGDVRSLSHLLDSPVSRLETVSVQPPHSRAAGESTGGWLARAIRQSTAVDPIQPIPVTLTIWLAAIPLFVWTFGFRGLALLVVIGSTLTLTYLAVARRILQPRLLAMRTSMRITTLSGVVLISAAVSTATVYFWYPPEVGELIGLFLRTFIVTGLAVAGWAGVAASAAQSRRSQTALAATVTERRLQVASLQTRLAQLQRGAGEIVHGKVQGCLVAAALTLAVLERRIASLPDTGTVDVGDSELLGALDDAAGMLLDAQREISSVGTAIDRPLPETVQFFDSIAETWSSIMLIAYRLEDDAVVYLDEHERLREFVCETAREAFSNAARHGAATVVLVELTMSPGRLTLRCTDNGLGIKRIVSGRGLGRLDEAGVEWDLTASDPRGAQLTVTFLLAGLP